MRNPLARRLRVPVPLTPSEYRALERYAARGGRAMSRVLLAVTAAAITAIERGEDPLGLCSKRDQAAGGIDGDPTDRSDSAV